MSSLAIDRPTSRSRSRYRDTSSSSVRRRSSSHTLRRSSDEGDFTTTVLAPQRASVQTASPKTLDLSKEWRLLQQLLATGLAVFIGCVVWSYFTVIEHATADPSWVLKEPIGLSHYDRLTNASAAVLKQYHIGAELDEIISHTNEIVTSIKAFSEGELSERLGVDFHDFSTTLAYGRRLQQHAVDLRGRINDAQRILSQDGLLNALTDLQKFNTTRWINKNSLNRRKGQDSEKEVSDILKRVWSSPHRDPLNIWKHYLQSRHSTAWEIYKAAEAVFRAGMEYRETWDLFEQYIAKDRVWAIEQCKKLMQRKFLFVWSRPEYCRITRATWYDPQKIWDEKPGLRMDVLRIMAAHQDLKSANRNFARHMANVGEAIRPVKSVDEFYDMEVPLGIKGGRIPSDIEAFVADQAEVAMGIVRKVIDDVGRGFREKNDGREEKRRKVTLV